MFCVRHLVKSKGKLKNRNKKLREKSTTVLAVSLVGAGLYYLYITDGPHSALLRSSEKEILWGLYWVWVGRHFF